MAMFKLTAPVTIIDVNGNSNETEQTIVFSNREELIEFISGDTDGDVYGSSLIHIKEYDNELYTQVGKMCNHIVAHLLRLEKVDKEIYGEK